ncbi:Crp/Fnr family transcriptional regulator [Rhodoferax sp.]|uniref:Crp/Fnr family transcriptional regulator n=1 Tax=Rhodoferax sp. TaxID=50421 RepID=UPI0025F059A0|nr:Crp/Fnr family transcriptional regulator [Rhodoferax sp.]
MSRRLTGVFVERLDLGRVPLQSAHVGATVMQSGASVERLPVVVSGRLDSVLHLQGEGGAYIIPVSFGAGEMVFLSQLFSRQPSFVDLVVGEAATLRWVQVNDVEQLLLADSALMVELVRFLVQRLREVQMRERAWLERGVHERVCATLARLAHQQASASDGTVAIVTTHEELSARSGVSRPKLSQELKRLEQQGRLKLDRGSVRIIDLSNLFDPAD